MKGSGCAPPAAPKHRQTGRHAPSGAAFGGPWFEHGGSNAVRATTGGCDRSRVGEAHGGVVRIGFLLFPNVTQLDLTGPLQVLHRLPGASVHVVAQARGPVMSDCGLALVANEAYDTCAALDVLCVPGGAGVLDAMADSATLEFVRRQAAGARFVTSVCTGAFVLGTAGLLRGKHATTHWAYTSLLPLVGAIPTPGRVVRDGAVITGGGVTAGIDFALSLVAELAGEGVAADVALALEYDPAPVRPGAPEAADPAVLQAAVARFAPRLAIYREALGG